MRDPSLTVFSVMCVATLFAVLAFLAAAGWFILQGAP